MSGQTKAIMAGVLIYFWSWPSAGLQPPKRLVFKGQILPFPYVFSLLVKGYLPVLDRLDLAPLAPTGRLLRTPGVWIMVGLRLKKMFISCPMGAKFETFKVSDLIEKPVAVWVSSLNNLFVFLIRQQICDRLTYTSLWYTIFSIEVFPFYWDIIIINCFYFRL